MRKRYFNCAGCGQQLNNNNTVTITITRISINGIAKKIKPLKITICDDCITGE